MVPGGCLPIASFGPGKARRSLHDLWWVERRSHSPLFPTSATVAYSRLRAEGVIPLADDMTSTRFLTVREVADTLRVSNMTVYRLINSGVLPAVRVGKSFRLRADDVNRYLADQYTRAG
jgi:excisionase family DNA binding protein